MRLAVLSVHCNLRPSTINQCPPWSPWPSTLAPAITTPVAPPLGLPAARAAPVVGLPPVHIKIPNQG